MTNILLAKPTLPAGWIDCSVGEPHVVRENLVKIFGLSVYELPNVPHMHEYPTPVGYEPLISLLEEKHKAPVIITNGAKQALGACFHALNQMNLKVFRNEETILGPHSSPTSDAWNRDMWKRF